MRYQVQHIEDCSNRELARVRLTEALAATGHPEAAITVRVIRDSQEAAEMAFHGSPTILADGIDLFPTTAESGAVACRVYATPAGLAGTPTVAQMVDAIRVHEAAGQGACSCCGRILPRRKLHSLHHGAAYICRRCGAWVALWWRKDSRD